MADGPHLCKRDPASSFMLIMPAALISTIKPMINCLEVFSDVSSLVPGGADWTSSIFGLIGYYCV